MPEITADNRELGQDFEEFAALELESHIAELDESGLTTIPAEKVASHEFTVRLRDRILELAARRTGVTPATEQSRRHADIEAMAGQEGEAWLWRILFLPPGAAQALFVD